MNDVDWEVFDREKTELNVWVVVHVDNRKETMFCSYQHFMVVRVAKCCITKCFFETCSLVPIKMPFASKTITCILFGLIESRHSPFIISRVRYRIHVDFGKNK